MTHPNEPDLGPLSWVKNEIDLALARADESLEYAADARDAATRVQFAQTHLHQVRGALSIVGLDGLTQLASSLDQTLGLLSRGERPIDAPTLALARRALATIGNYLDELVHGTPDQPLRLLALYKELAAARGPDPVSPAELFFPDLSVRPPRGAAAAVELDEDGRQQQQRAQRAAFQRGLLQWLRGADDAAGPRAMLDAVAAVEALHVGAPAATLWHVAQAFLDAIVHGDLPPSAEIKRLCSQLDAQLKRLADAPAAIPDRLLRELLYWTSQAPERSERQRAVRAAWHLDALLPEPGAAVSAMPLAPLLKSLQGLASAAKLAWDGFSSGHAADLPRFESLLSELVAHVPQLGRPALERLLRTLVDFVHWLRKDPLRCTDPIALEVATALLLGDAAIERGAPEAGFAAQVADTDTRLRALMRGEAIAPAERSCTVATARRAQERDALRQLSREILSSLAQVEQTLDDYFRNPQKRAPLAHLAAPLKQVEGALTLLGDGQAIALVHAAAETIAALAEAETPPPQTAFESLARQLSALGFYVEALQHGAADLERFLGPTADLRVRDADDIGAAAAATPDTPAPGRPLREAAPEIVVGLEAPIAAVEPVPSERPQTEAPCATPAIAPGLMPAPGFERPDEFAFASPRVEAAEEAPSGAEAFDDRLAARTSGTADVLEKTFALLDDIDLELSPGLVQEIELSPAPVSESPAEARAEAALDAVCAPIAAPEAVAVVATAHDIDAELLDIFIEEAHDVLATIGRLVDASRGEPAETAHLTGIRRGFHTLKGSGRMVGLRDLGDAAWGIEQTLNRWLQLEWTPTPTLHEMLENAHRTFSDWVRELETGGSEARDVAALVAEAERLRSSDVPIVEAAAIAAPQRPVEAGIERELRSDEDVAARIEDEALEAEAIEPLDLEDLLRPESGAAPSSADAAGEADLLPEEMPLEDLLAPDALEPVAALESVQAQKRPAVQEPADALEPIEASIFDFGDLPASEAVTEMRAPFDDLTPARVVASRASPEETSGAAEAVLAEDVEPLDLDPSAEALAGELLEFDEMASVEARVAVPLAAPADEAPQQSPAPSETVEALGAAAFGGAPEPASGAGLEAVAPAAPDLVRIGDTEVSRPLYDLYLAEARHHLAVLHTELARLKANPTLVPAEQALRAAHTLAGISGTTRVMTLQGLARGLEHAIERLRDHDLAPSAEQAALLNTANDTLEAMLAQVSACTMPLDVPELAEQLDGVGREVSLEPLGDADVLRSPAAASAPLAGPAGEAAERTAPTPVHDDLDAQLLPIFLEEGADLVGQLHAALRAWRSGDDDGPPQAVARLLHTLKGSARMAGAMTLGEHVHQLESRLQSGQEAATDASALIDELVAGLDLAEQMFDRIAAGEPLPAVRTPESPTAATEAGTAEAESTAAGTLLRVRAEAVDRFVNEAGEIGIARTRIAGELRTMRRSLLDLTENVIRLRNQLREVEIQADVQMPSRITQSGAHDGEFDPLEMDRYTRLQELTRMMAESVGDVTTVQQNLLRNLDATELALNNQARLSRDLQQSLMQVRMVPFDSLADRLYRVVRQTAKDLGKRANLDLRGGRIEIDRSVLEHMTAPLEHLLRNAIAHGIETPAMRREAGKDEIGQITLTVSQEGNEVAIVLADDGGGLDFAKIAERARASGLLGADEATDERRLTNLIFIPGFSTAGNVSTVSGRGVGMDVVKSETAAVGGRIDILPAGGRGTEFRIYLPLTLAVTQALLIRAGARSFAVPSSMVAQVLELKADALAALQRAGGTDWQGQRFAYRYLPQLLGDRLAQPQVQRFTWVLLLRAGAQTLALHVDALRGNQEIVVKNAGPQLARIVGISGATVLGDGEIVLILNPVALASRSLCAPPALVEPTVPTAAPEALEPLEPFEAAVDPMPTVMVVDDSLTVRKITGRLLEREGYRVVTAKDGVDALERLVETVPAVILSDIEMPRMDGFDLLRNIRADERLCNVPVIMITSRLADKHRQYAEKIGARHYLGKPYEEAELLGLLRQYTGRPVPA